MTNYYRVTVGTVPALDTRDVREAYGMVGSLLAAGLLVRGTELRITFVSANGITHPVSLNWAR
jgi:hypothetical protein